MLIHQNGIRMNLGKGVDLLPWMSYFVFQWRVGAAVCLVNLSRLLEI